MRRAHETMGIFFIILKTVLRSRKGKVQQKSLPGIIFPAGHGIPRQKPA